MSTYTATSQDLGKGRRRITLWIDGVADQGTNTGVADYAWVNVQGWDHTDKVAMRLGREARKIGSRLEYGHIVAAVPITEA